MVFELIKIRLSGLLSTLITGKKTKNTRSKISKGKTLIYIILFAYIAVIFAGMATLYASLIGSLLIPYGFERVYFGLFSFLAFTLVFLLSIFETKATLYESRDNELLLSMPIPVKDIIISRISAVLIYNYAETALFMIPVIAVYAALGGALRGIIGGIVLLLFIPVLAAALSSGVGYLVAVISKKLKKNTLVTVIISLGFLAAYFISYNYIISGIEDMAEASPELAIALAENFGVFGIVGGIALLEPVPLCVFILLSLTLGASAYALISKNYISIITKSDKGVRRASKQRTAKPKSLFFALAEKELRAFLSSANYILNAGIGSVFGIVVSVMALLNRDTILALIGEIDLLFPELSKDTSGAVALIASLVLFAAASMSFIAAPALSLEGRSLWILKSLPVSARDILLAKITPHILISSLTSVISSVIMIYALEISPAWWALLLLLPLIGSALGAFLCGTVGAALPNFDHASEVQVIKQSASSAVSMLSSMLLGIGTLVGGYLLLMLMPPIYAAAMVIFLLVALTALFAFLLLCVMAKKFDKI